MKKPGIKPGFTFFKLAFISRALLERLDQPPEDHSQRHRLSYEAKAQSRGVCRQPMLHLPAWEQQAAIREKPQHQLLPALLESYALSVAHT
jgi:hypothetical protein